MSGSSGVGGVHTSVLSDVLDAKRGYRGLRSAGTASLQPNKKFNGRVIPKREAGSCLAAAGRVLYVSNLFETNHTQSAMPFPGFTPLVSFTAVSAPSRALRSLRL